MYRSVHAYKHTNGIVRERPYKEISFRIQAMLLIRFKWIEVSRFELEEGTQRPRKQKSRIAAA